MVEDNLRFVCVFSVYATTAANPHESSYACYYDARRETYLGDWYSVNWMEDSDVVGWSVKTSATDWRAWAQCLLATAGRTCWIEQAATCTGLIRCRAAVGSQADSVESTCQFTLTPHTSDDSSVLIVHLVKAFVLFTPELTFNRLSTHLQAKIKFSGLCRFNFIETFSFPQFNVVTEIQIMWCP